MLMYSPGCCLLSAIGTFPGGGGGGGEIAKVIPSKSNPIGIDLDLDFAWQKYILSFEA